VPEARFRGLLRHAPVALDQGLSSGSNFVLAILVAQSATAAEYGQFALATSVYWLVLGGMRALIAEPLLIIQSGHGGSRRDISAGVALAVTVSVAAAAVGVALGLGIGWGAVPVLLVCLPVLIWQDMLRYSAFCLERPREALISDGVWLALLVSCGALVLIGGHQLSVEHWILLWAGSSLAPMLFASARLGVWPAVAAQAGWWRQSRRQAAPMFGDFLVYTGAENLVVFLVPLVSSLALLGQIKAAQVVNGPLSVLLSAATIAALPLMARQAGAGVVPVRTGLLAGLAMGAVAVVYGIALLVLPQSWGELLFGETWSGVGILPALLAFQFALLGVSVGAQLVLRATGQAGRLLVIRLLVAPVVVGVPLVAVWLGGTVAYGLAESGVAGLLGAVWWALVVRGRRRPPAPLVPEAVHP
jgi:O-antigen/teichoic acid export membrane protein